MGNQFVQHRKYEILSNEALESIQNVIDNKIYTLDLRNQQIIYIPPDFVSSLNQLTRLQLSNNKLSNLPASFGCLSSLQELSLDRNMLIELPLSFSNLQNLKHLDISNNKIQNINGNFSDLKNLEKLWFSSNEINYFPESFGELIHLTYIDISQNNIEELPLSMINLINLEYLDISENKLKKLPDLFLDKLYKLEILKLNHNNIILLNEIDINGNKYNKIHSLTVLSLNNNQLNYLPNNLFQKLSNIKILNISTNQINIFPKYLISNNNRIHTLIHSQNKLSDINESLFQLTYLLYLDLSENMLRTLPPNGWHCLTHLKELLLNNNRLISCPFTQIFEMSSLIVLNLSFNKLVSFNLIKKEIEQNQEEKSNMKGKRLCSLRHFYLNNNIINNFNIDHCNDLFSSIESLDISTNELTRISEKFTSMIPKLEFFKVDRKLFLNFDSDLIHLCNEIPHFQVNGVVED